MKFEGKVVFITGGARGIGEHFGRCFAVEGARVILADVDLETAEAAASDIRAAGGDAVAVYCDVARRASVETAVEEALAAYEGIDILINNAAKHLLEYAVPITELTIEKWQSLLDINIMGIVHCSAVCKPAMIARGGGIIINMSSIAGFLSNSAYGVSKLAVRGLTVALALEMAAHNVRVFGIAPGNIDSAEALKALAARAEANIDRQPIKRQGRLRDLVGPLFFLCSEDSAFMTGETMVVGGGFPTRL